MNNITNYEIHVFGMNRSGQHAIVSWLLGMFESVLFKNNMGEGRFVINPTKKRSWPFYYYQKYGKTLCRGKWELFAPEYKIDAIILGSENAEIKTFSENYNKDFIKQKQKIVKIAKQNGCDVNGFSKKQIFIPVIRSPHNHASSCLKWRSAKHPINQPENFITLWKSYAKEYLGITSFLPNISIPLNYDKWFVDENYRKKIFSQMNVNVDYSEKNLNKVLSFGKGSSFSRQSKNNKAQGMKVLNRWEYWIKPGRDNTHYLSMLRDKELIDLSNEIYDKMPYAITKEIGESR